MDKLKVLDLFSGIGGFSLGLERAGMETVAFCEFDKKCQLVLKKHWPDVPIYDDIRTLTHERLKADGIRTIDLVCGGFPCQNISTLGSRKGLNGERSGLWFEYFHLIGELRPKYAIIENTSNLLRGGRGDWFYQILGNLASIGYDAEWECIPAVAIGARHLRWRVWIMAYAKGYTKQGSVLQGIEKYIIQQSEFRGNTWGPAPGIYWEKNQPPFVDMDDGVSGWVECVKQLGNAVVPQIPEIIGRAIIEFENKRNYD